MAKDHKQLVYYLDHLLPRQLAVKHTNSSSAKGASATLLGHDGLCYPVFCYIDSFILILFVPSKLVRCSLHSDIGLSRCIFRKLFLLSTVSHGSCPSKNLHNGSL